MTETTSKTPHRGRRAFRNSDISQSDGMDEVPGCYEAAVCGVAA